MVFLFISLKLIEYIEVNDITFMTIVVKLAHFYILIHIFYWEIKSVDENFERLGYNIKILKLVSNLFRFFNKLVENKIKQENK